MSAAKTTERNRLALPERCDTAPGFVDALIALFGFVLRLLFRIEVSGNRAFGSDPIIVVANHLSWVDPLVLLMYGPRKPRLWFVGKTATALNSWWKRLLIERAGGLIPVYPGSRLGAAMALAGAVRALERGGSVVIFPEGGVGEVEGTVGPFRPGVGYLAAHSPRRIVPVAISGSHDLYRGKRIRVIFGDPFSPPDGMTSEELASGFIREKLQTLLPDYHDNYQGVKRWTWLKDLLY